MDASVRFKGEGLKNLYPLLLKNGGFSNFKRTPLWTYLHVHPNVYRLLPSSSDKLRVTHAAAATGYVMHLTEDIYWNIAHWYFLCPLDPDCMPTGAKKLLENAKKDTCKDITWLNHPAGAITRAQCHGYEQPMLNVLVSNYYGFNEDEYCPLESGNITLQRHPTTKYTIKYCK